MSTPRFHDHSIARSLQLPEQYRHLACEYEEYQCISLPLLRPILASASLQLVPNPQGLGRLPSMFRRNPSGLKLPTLENTFSNSSLVLFSPKASTQQHHQALVELLRGAPCSAPVVEPKSQGIGSHALRLPAPDRQHIHEQADLNVTHTSGQQRGHCASAWHTLVPIFTSLYVWTYALATNTPQLTCGTTENVTPTDLFWLPHDTLHAAPPVPRSFPLPA